ncbi:MAG: ATP-binding protein [Hyphomicrobiaceae bacterium]|nr:ATP-binding protein [Hyphomicrobiaceae bacterium]
MRWIWDTIAGRTIVVLVAGLAISLGLSQYLYQRGMERELREGNASRLADHLIVLRETLMRLPENERDEAAHALSGGPLQLHWSPEALSVAGGTPDPTSVRIREILFERLAGLEQQQLVIGSNPDANATPGGHRTDHLTLISLALTDGTWLNMSLAQVQEPGLASPSFIGALLLLSLAVGLLSYLMSLWLTRPLRDVAKAARRIFAGAQDVTLAETGTREVRDLVAAFNDLQDRIKRLVGDRTNMLAAVSHDLRTPLTRLRLRVEGLGMKEPKESIIRDISEMESMLDATLAFIRGDASEEPVEQIDLAAMLQTIANEFEDAGQPVDLASIDNLIITARPQTMKRAIINVVQNALKHGGSARIETLKAGRDVRIVITDTGPGIPEDQLESVFAPFTRLDQSRNSTSGGHGLGLTIARIAIRLHGGDVTLANLAEGGLVATMSLPQ